MTNSLPKPYFEDGAVTIYRADCRELLPSLGQAYVLLTDPPYGIDGGRGGQARAKGKGNYESNLWEDTPEYITKVVVPIIKQALDISLRGAVTPGIRCMMEYPRPADIGAFFAPAASNVGSWGFTTFHPIFYYGRDYRAGKGTSATGRVVTERAEDNGHPCPKPLQAWKWLLEKVSQPGEILLDPFMGSGTTLRAAKDLGRKAIGIEIEERYCEIAAERMRQSVFQLDMEPPTPASERLIL